MGDRLEALQAYTSDMLALEQHIKNALERQVGEDALKEHSTAQQLVEKARTTVDAHIENLKEHLSMLGGDTGSGLKGAVTSAAGAVAGMIDKMRSEEVSRFLRDDYTALSLAAISYTMLHATGLTLKDEATADLAADHLMDLTPIIAELSEVIPEVVVKEVSKGVDEADTSVTYEAIRNTQEAWESNHVHGSHTHGHMKP